MEIKKEAQASSGGVPTQAQLEKINTLAKARLRAEQVYVFALRLCDDQVDRDWESFDREALPALAKMFVGKTGILDHGWRTDNQVARIFETQVAEEQGTRFIKAWAYMRRGGEQEAMIADIEAGIKKEVSVGCAMGEAVCSICGGEAGSCGHVKGQWYEGKLCWAILRKPLDAYEFSFVAVPAQREAGVMKALGGRKSLKALAEEFGAQGEYQALIRQAQLGERYQKELENSVVRLGMALELGVEAKVLQGLVSRADPEDLGKLKEALEKRLAESLPMESQLLGKVEVQEVESGFLV